MIDASNRWWLLGVAVFLLPSHAHAYIDPGTGGLIIQIVAGGIAGSLVILRLYWGRVKAVFSRQPEKPSAEQSDSDSDEN